MEAKQNRIFLWTCSRSLSTAFYRAINNAPGTLGKFEPYYVAHRYGGEPETNKTNAPEKAGYKFLDIKEELNQPYIDYTTIFVKALAYRIMAAPCKIEDILPEGYVHTFLIRDPRKCITSLYRMFTKRELSGWTKFDKRHGGTKQLYDLYTLLTSELDMNCLIVDADDLEKNPEAVLTAYCDFVGIQFHPSIVKWDMADPSKLEAFKDTTKGFTGSFFTTATTVNGFQKAKESQELDLSNYPPIVKETIEEHMPYYELLYKQRFVIH